MNTDPIIHVWITKYALTEGIQETDAEHCLAAAPKGTMINCPSLGVFATFHGEGRDWHRTKEGAVAKAEKMRLAKIVNLQKMIKKLEAMKFERVRLRYRSAPTVAAGA
jgi:hypothetical protein